MPPPTTKTTTTTTTTSTSSSSSSTPDSFLASFGLDDDTDCSSLSSAPSSPLPPPGFSLPSPSRDPDESSAFRSQDDDLPPARKKRRVAAPKERRTQHLDLSPAASISRSEQQSQIDLLVKTLRRHRKIIVIAGAGISTSAGIPDFRSTDGLFKSLQKKHNLKASGKLLFDAAVYQDETLTASFQDMVRSLSEEAAKTSPTEFHHMLARLGHESRLTRLYTQNIDGIETSMPPLATQIPLNNKAPWPRTIQLHGSLDKMVCQKCRHLRDFDCAMFDRPDAPECPECSKNNQFRIETGQRSHGIGKMRPRIVLYNEHNPDEEAIASVMNADIRSRPDALIVVGTSLKIPGVRRLVKSLCSVIRSRRNGVTMWINNELPSGKEFEDCWDLMVKGDCEDVARLARLKRWDDTSDSVFDECNSSEIERVKREQGPISIVIQTPRKKQKTQTGFLTPSSSQDEDVSDPAAKPASSKPCPNPASKGRKITDVLQGSKKNPPKKTTAKKTAPRKRTKKDEQPKNTRITTFSKVTKAQKVMPNGDKSTKMEKEETKPMHPLPPGAARNNGPMFPHLTSKGATTPSGNRWHQPETISPKSVPKGMSELLNEPTP